MNEDIRYCSTCETDRLHHSFDDYVEQDEKGKIGKFTHYYCHTCQMTNYADFHKLAWLLIDNYTVLRVYLNEQKAKDAAINHKGLYINVVEKVLYE